MIMSRLEAGGPEDMSATEWRAPGKDSASQGDDIRGKDHFFLPDERRVTR